MYVRNALLAAAVATVANSAVHTVEVGEDGLSIEPQNINPKKGDTVIFHLYPRHNVVSGPFDKPCESNDASWFSGPFDKTDGGKKKFVVNVTSEDPVYYYCAVPSHCQNGMVGSWNAPSSGNTLQAYSDAAKKAGDSTAPSSIKGGELLEDSQLASLTSGSPSATQSGNSTSPASTGKASTTAVESGKSSGSPTASATRSSTSAFPGAADSLHAGSVTGIFAMAVGLVAWLL